MKTAIGVLALALGIASALPASAQLEVASYDRTRPYIFCGSVPQGDELSVPFDLVNNGAAAVTIDSAIATGDTLDFYSNRVIATNEPYLNPLVWKYLSDKTIEAGSSSFTNFFFAPKSPGAKALTITVYYHDASGAPLTAQATVSFHTSDAPAGLGFLRSMVDTIRYGGNLSNTAITYDRTLVMDTLTIRDTVLLGDTLRAAITGEDRIDLTSCGGVTITAVELAQESSDDIFKFIGPAVPFSIPSGSTSLVDFIYIPLSKETVGRQAYITFKTAEGYRAVLHLIVVAPEKSAVEDEPVRDERGRITILRAGIESIPNPFSGSTTIRVSTAAAGHARLGIFNTLGQEVAVLLDERLETGVRDIVFDAAGLPAGVYFARLETAGVVRVRELKIQN